MIYCMVVSFVVNYSVGPLCNSHFQVDRVRDNSLYCLSVV